MPTLSTPLFATMMTPETALAIMPLLMMPLYALFPMVIVPTLVIVTPKSTTRVPVTTRENLAGMTKLVVASPVSETVQMAGLAHVPPMDVHIVGLSKGLPALASRGADRVTIVSEVITRTAKRVNKVVIVVMPILFLLLIEFFSW